jgi:hypothetical protein
MTRDEWTIAFAAELRRLRGIEHWNSRFAAALAQQQYIQHRDEDPVKVAQAWIKRQGKA